MLLGRPNRNDEPAVAREVGANGAGGEPLQVKRRLAFLGDLAHWEWLVVACAAGVGGWLVRPTLGWAIVTLGLGVLALVASMRTRRFGVWLTVLVVSAAAVTAVSISARVHRVERSWPSVREEMVEAASARLDAALGDAVDLVRRLAMAGVEFATMDTADAMARLPRVIARAPEQSVAIFGAGVQPWAWAGQYRVPPSPVGPELSAHMTPFYAVLEARRQVGARTIVAQVLLATDSAVPDPERSVAARFERETGVGLQFLEPDRAPNAPDIFDYCLPACGPTAVAPHPDTLFAVQTSPPSQGERKLDLLARGGRLVALSGLASLLLLTIFGGNPGRWVGAFAIVGMLVATPAGERVGLATLFSPGVYFLEALGPLSSAAGPLLLAGAVCVVALTQLLRHTRPAPSWRVGAGVVVAVATPFVMWRLASGITPPSTPIGVGLWIDWELTLATVGAAFGLAAAVLGGGARHASSRWRWIALAAAVMVLAFVGLVTWQPTGDWPLWYAALWIGPALLAVWPAPRTMRLVAVAAVAGVGASILTWGAVVHGRMELAAQDVGRLSGGDPIAIGFLERFGESLQGAPTPRSAAQLYAAWQRSPLSEDDYPAVLDVWAPDSRLEASLTLARLELSPALFERFAAAARESGRAIVRTVDVEPGVHYVAAVPLEGGWVVTVGVGPRSRAIEPVLVSRFLRGERRIVAPYELRIGEHVPTPSGVESLQWEREGWSVGSTVDLRLPEGTRHLQVTVPLRDPAPLAVRGALAVLLDVAVLALLALVGEALTRSLRIPAGVRSFVRFRSYRIRLAAVLAGFFVLPTLGFTAWSVSRLRGEAARTRDLVIAQTLQDAAGQARQFTGLPPDQVQDRLDDLAERLGADLAWYQGPVLTEASMQVLAQLGLLGVYLPPDVYRRLAFQDALEVTSDQSIGGQPTRIGYRALGAVNAGAPVLAVPRLVDVTDIQRQQEDLLFTLLLATILGLGGALGLATLASRGLARPVHSLQVAAETVGRGESAPSFGPDVPEEFVSVVGAFRRMAEDVEASQHDLEAARDRTATVLANVATGVVALDEHMLVTIANRRAEELIGASLPSGAPVVEVGGGGWEPLWRWVGEFMHSGVEHSGHEFTVDGRRIRVQAAVLHADPRGCVVALDDATELAQAVRVLAWGELARQIAHEIKNPLTPIRLGVQHLQRARRHGRPDFDATLERTSSQILAEIERLDAIARSFARFGAPTTDAGPVGGEDLLTLARDVAALYALGDARVRVDGVAGLTALVRKDEFKEVLVNLIENAREAEASRVDVAVTAAEPEWVRLTVRDDGRGIAPEHLPQIFEPRFSTTTSGTGLGLAICKRLVESWGGTIEVESVPGSGTAVRIDVPAAAAA